MARRHARRLAQTPNVDKLVLTKRIGNVPMRLGQALTIWFRGPTPTATQRWDGWPRGWRVMRRRISGSAPPWVNQKEADRDIPKLLRVPAKVRFVSLEPLLSPVDLFSAFTDELLHTSGNDYDPGSIDWVIVGGETGPGARPMNPAWARRVREQCAAAGIPFIFKQFGSWGPINHRGMTA